MWFLHLAIVSMRPAEMTSKIGGNSPASLQVSHRRRKKNKKKNKQTNFRVYATHERVNISYHECKLTSVKMS